MQLLAGIGPLGIPELLIIAFIVVLVFGVGRLPEVGNAVGKSIKEFRKATKEDEASPELSSASSTMSAPAADMPGSATWGPGAAPSDASGSDTIFCAECGTKNARAAKFCSQCGHTIGAPVS